MRGPKISYANLTARSWRLGALGLIAAMALAANAAALPGSTTEVAAGGHALRTCAVLGYGSGPETEPGVLSHAGVTLHPFKTTSDVYNGYRVWFKARMPDGRVAVATIASSKPNGGGAYRVRRISNIGPVAVTYRDSCLA